jgi:hypothetical protein
MHYCFSPFRIAFFAQDKKTAFRDVFFPNVRLVPAQGTFFAAQTVDCASNMLI